MSSEVAEALKKAKYNELVHIHLVDDDGESRELVLAANLDKQHGGVQWNTTPSTLKRHLCTKRWFFPMLNDRVRNEMYERAIRLASQEVVHRFGGSSSSKERTLSLYGLDIGSGTGLLAMLSAKYLNESLKSSSPNASINITSFEMSSAMARIATMTVKDNSLQHQINIQEAHSCEIQPLKPNAHLCTSELLESGLLAEGWIPAMRDAWNRHLLPNAVVVPQRARVFAQIVGGDGLQNYWGPHTSIKGFPENESMRLWHTVNDGEEFLLGGSGEGITIPIHAKQLLLADNDIFFLSEPISILDIDVSSRDVVPGTDGQSKEKEFIATASGKVSAVLFWWELSLFGDTLTYSTHHDQQFQDHWQQCLFVFSKTQDECLELVQGKPAILQARHDDSRVYFAVAESTDKKRPTKRLRPTIILPTVPSISPERAWQLNDEDRMNALRDGISFALRDDAFVLDLSDFSLCAIMAALLGAKQVFSIESSSGDVPMMAARIAQLSNNLDDPSKFQILQCHPENLDASVFGETKIPNLVVAEPYYQVLEGWHLQEALNYFYILRSLKERQVIQDDARSVPASASVMVCAFESADLGQAYQHADLLCGFHHETVNSNSDLYGSDILIPSWQYDISLLTEPLQVATIDYERCVLSCSSENDSATPITSSGTLHGIIMWIEYKIQTGDTSNTVVSTKGRGHHQVIRMFASSQKVEPRSGKFFCQLILEGCNDSDYDFKFGVQ